MRWTIAFVLAVLVLWVSVASAAACDERTSLARCLEDWVTQLEKGDVKAATRFARDADAARAIKERWEQLKKCHADYDYRRWLDSNPDTKGHGARGVGDATQFTVGGHSHGHVHVRWEKTEGQWEVADVWLCR